MKPTLALLYLLAAFLGGCTSCKREQVEPVDATGLPPVSQEGKNTIGCLINGEKFVPVGHSFGFANPTASYSGYNSQIGCPFFNVIMSKRDKISDLTLSIGIQCPRPGLRNLDTLSNSSDKWYFLFFNDLQSCNVDEPYRSPNEGQLTISRFDDKAKVIAGTFWATYYGNRAQGGTCNTLRITNGRFDLKILN